MNSTLKRPLFIIGLQKSGTTLLNRLLIEQSEYFFSPFKLEGRGFWGDDPPFSPAHSPCGEIYQKHQGMHGHQATEEDFDINHQKLLHQRISQVNIDAPILINKNPYNTMRITWLKKMFPDCKIVAMVRNPYANIFSLMKKHIPHEGRGLGPEDGWWGVKPKYWNKLLCKNKVAQLAKQWREVNKEIIQYHKLLDLIINYKDLCEDPNLYISCILNLYEKEGVTNLPSLTCMDDEYKTGSQLLSKNRQYNQTKSFNLINNSKNIKFLNKLNISQLLIIKVLTMRSWKYF